MSARCLLDRVNGVSDALTITTDTKPASQPVD